MATVVIGDVHGNLRALDDLLAQLGTRLAAKDTAVFLGDYIDRGPDSRGCIDRMDFLLRPCRQPISTP
jgi:predicted phosphodiesterase